MARERERVSGRRAAENDAAGFGSYLKVPEGIQTLKVDQPGVMFFDFYPYRVGAMNPNCEKGKLHYERTYFLHRGIGAAEERIICPARTWKKRCPVCEDVQQLAKDAKTSKDTLQALYPQQRQLWLTKDLKTPERGVQLWDFSRFSFGKLLNERIKNSDDELEGWAFFADPEDGHSLRVTFSKEPMGDGGSYIKATAIDFKKRSAPLDMAVVEALPCLDDLMVEMPYIKMKAIYLQCEEAQLDDGGHPTGTARAPGAATGGGDTNLDDGWNDSPADPPKKEEAAKKEEPKKETKPAAKKEAPAGTVELERGKKVQHPEKGEVEIIKIDGDVITCEVVADGDVVKLKRDSFGGKKEAPAPKKEEAPAKAIEKGDTVKNADHGVCKVIKIADGMAVVEAEKDGEIYKVPLDECVLKPSTNGAKKETKPAAKKEEPAAAPAGGGDDNWDDNWEERK